MGKAKRKAFTAHALVAHYLAVRLSARNAQEISRKRHAGLVTPTIYVPEAPDQQFFVPGTVMERMATVALKQGIFPGSPERDALSMRTARYEAVLAEWIALDEAWREVSGLNAVDAAERVAVDAREVAWKAIVTRYRHVPRDRPVINRFLAKRDDVEPWRLRQVFQAAGAR